MKFDLENYIVLDPQVDIRSLKIRDYRKGNNMDLYKYTVNGCKLFPIETVLPIIKKGKSCIGVGTISEITINANTTTILFTIVDDRTDYSALYELYRAQKTSSASTSDDSYDDYDQIVPGAYSATRANAAPTIKDNSRARRTTGPSVPGYMKDIDEEDDDEFDFQKEIFDKLFGK